MKNGTIYKKVSTDYLAEIVPSVKSEISVPNKKSLPPKQRPIAEKKKYVCENTWQDFGDIADQLERITPDWKYFVEKKVRSEYREGVDDIEITGASAKGVYLNATGNSTGTIFKVLWACNGSIIIYDTVSEN